MKRKIKSPLMRRAPKQLRANQTIEIILDAVIKILKRGGINHITTNRITEVAGVSIGSIYQYFPDKRAIYTALHQRHTEDVGHLIEKTLIAKASENLETTIERLIDALLDAHISDPEMYELLTTQVPQGAELEETTGQCIYNSLKLLLTAHLRLHAPVAERVLFVISNILEPLTHATAIKRPSSLSVSRAKQETVKIIMAYLSIDHI